LSRNLKRLKFLFHIIVAWVPSRERQAGRKLRLGCRLQPGGDGRDPDLRAFRVQVAAEPLEVGAEVQDEAPQGLVKESRLRRD
jgi:hypothetical protein